MNCPECKNKLIIPDYAHINVDVYRKPQMIITECCSKMVWLHYSSGVKVGKYLGELTTDSWGNKLSC